MRPSVTTQRVWTSGPVVCGALGGCRVSLSGAIATAVAISLTSWPVAAHGQETRAEQLAAQKAEHKRELRPPERERGEVIVEFLERLVTADPPDVVAAFGPIRPGAGVSPGLTAFLPLGPDVRLSARGQWSIADFKSFETSVGLVPSAAARWRVGMNARFEDAPTLNYFGLASAGDGGVEVRFGLRTSTVGATAEVRPARPVTLRAAAEYLHIESSPGARRQANGDVATSVPAPGLGAEPSWIRGTVALSVDLRESPGYTRSGGLYHLSLHDYRDAWNHQYSFRVVELDLRQFVPLANENWVIAFQANTQVTDATADQTVPYFMLPYVGGGSTLRGFREYRFTDRHRVLVRSELRWTPARILDMAVFADGGKAVAARHEVDLRHLETAWGVGARLHGPTFTALRLEAARGRDGWRFHVGGGPSF